MSGLPILSLITFLPLLGALVIAVLPSDNFNLIRRAPSARHWRPGSCP